MMNYNVVEEMEKALSENNLGKARSILINSVLWGEDEDTIESLNKMAIENGVFEDDNGTGSDKIEKESFREYIERIREEVMHNFSKLKFERIREYFKIPKKKIQTTEANEDKSKVQVILEVGKQLSTKKKAATAAAVGLAALAFGVKIFGKAKSNKK